MPVEILSMTHDLTTLLFGIYISAFFLGVRQNYKNTGILFLFFCGEGLTYLLFSLTISDPFARQIYPLIVHLPLAIFLFLYYKYPLLSLDIFCLLMLSGKHLGRIVCSGSYRAGLVLLYGAYYHNACDFFSALPFCVPHNCGCICKRKTRALHDRFSSANLLYF